jgi:hypothetical protein
MTRRFFSRAEHDDRPEHEHCHRDGMSRDALRREEMGEVEDETAGEPPARRQI